MTAIRHRKQLTLFLTLQVTQKGVICSVSPQPKFPKSIANFVREAFRSFLQITHPQRQVVGDLQKQLQAKNKTEKRKTSAGGGLGLDELVKNMGMGMGMGNGKNTGGRDAN